jgi:hypothetical protein
MGSARRRAAGAACAVLALAGCVNTKPVVVAPAAIDDVRVVSTCGLTPVLVDRRPSGELGQLGYREFVFEDYIGYFERQLRLRFVGAGAQPTHRVELLRAYLESNRTTLSFNTVLRVRKPDEPDGTGRLYRGATTRISWFGNDGELAAFIERATADVLDKMAAGERCAPSGPKAP